MWELIVPSISGVGGWKKKGGREGGREGGGERGTESGRVCRIDLEVGGRKQEEKSPTHMQPTCT